MLVKLTTVQVLLLASLSPDERVLNFVMEGSKFPKNLLNGPVQKFNGTFFDVLFNREKKDQVKEEVRKRVSYYKSLFKKDNKQSIFTQVSILWHSYLPCYDIQNITSEKVSIIHQQLLAAFLYKFNDTFNCTQNSARL